MFFYPIHPPLPTPGGETSLPSHPAPHLETRKAGGGGSSLLPPPQPPPHTWRKGGRGTLQSPSRIKFLQKIVVFTYPIQLILGRFIRSVRGRQCEEGAMIQLPPVHTDAIVPGRTWIRLQMCINIRQHRYKLMANVCT